MFGLYVLNPEHLCLHTYTQSLRKNLASVKKNKGPEK